MKVLALLTRVGEQLALEFDGEGKRLSPAEKDPAEQEPFVARAAPMRRTMFDGDGVERPSGAQITWGMAT